MDQSSFDRLARLLGEATDRRAGLKAALGAIFGAGATSLAFDADAKNRKARDHKADEAKATRRRNKKKRCRPACEGGFDCVKGKCVCGTGVSCGDSCCLVGQACENGTCVPEPEPAACLELGEACKNVGKRCCDGLSCASGQDGSFPVACYKSKGAACAGTAECPYGMACQDGRCVGLQPPPAPDGCVAAGGACGGSSTCCEGTSCKDGTCAADPCAVTGLAHGAACCTSGQCTSGLCWYPQDDDNDPLPSPGGLQKVCVVATGDSCTETKECGLGNDCDEVCSDDLLVPPGGSGCNLNGPECVEDSTCISGTCFIDLGERCPSHTEGTQGYCAAGSTCRKYLDQPNGDDYCLLPNGDACESNSDCAARKCALIGSSTSRVCTECVTDAACEDINRNVALSTCMRWSCSVSGSCEQVVATNTLCSLGGGASGFCQADSSCAATTATCDVTSGSPADLIAALNNAPYKSAVSISGTYTLSAEISLNKFACKDNQNGDNNSLCRAFNPQDRLPWDVTLVACSGQTATIDGGSDVATANANPENWTWLGGSRIFKLTDYSMTIKDIRLQNGNANGSLGGAIWALRDSSYPLGGTLTLQDLTVFQCRGGVRGGGLETDLRKLTLKNVTFSKNWSSTNGGAVFARVSANTELVMNNVTMTSNVANSGSPTRLLCDSNREICKGAGIYMEGQPTDYGTVTCSNQTTTPSYSIDNELASYTPTAVAIGDCASSRLDGTTPIADWSTCGCRTTAVS